MQYIFIILVIILLLAVLFFINNKKVVSYDNEWVKLVRNRTVDSDKYYLFKDDAELIVDNKKKLIFIKAKYNNMAVYSNTDYLNKFMLIFSGYPSIKATFMEGYIVENNRLYYTYAYKSSYYERLHKWMELNGVFQSKEVWVAKKNIKWNSFPSPQYNDINWKKKAMIGLLS